jgi:hypothetical protein
MPTMEIFLERNADGITKVDGATFQVPTDRTALSVIGCNYIQDGDNFRSDGWVYGPDGKRRRKWFVRFMNSCSSQHNALIWKPKLENVALLEKKRWQFYQKAKRITEPMWVEMQTRIKEAGKFYGYVKFKNHESEGYVVFNQYGVSDGISWSWVNEGEEISPVNQQLTDDWFRYEELKDKYWGRYRLFHEAFLCAVDRKYGYNWAKRHNHPYKDIKLHLEINGRHYWFKRSEREYSEHFLSVIALPEDTFNLTEKVE